MKAWNLRNHEIYETMNPKKPRNLWNHKIHETYDTTNPMKPRNPWNQEP